MNRAVYSFLLKTYGRSLGFWYSIFAVSVQTILMRVVTSVIIAKLASNMVNHNIHGAKMNVLAYLGIVLIWLAVRLSKDLVSTYSENETYKKCILDYYKKLVNKDVSFYRDHQTGYLASTFRQHLDSAIRLVRLLRGDLIQIPVMLAFISWKISLIILGVIVVQIIYIMSISKTMNVFRLKTQETYRKVSGAVSDDITNIVTYKVAGKGKAAFAHIQKLAQEETYAFWQRRKKISLFNVPRELMTFVGMTSILWIIVNSHYSTGTTVGLVVLTVTYMMQIFSNVSVLTDTIDQHDEYVTQLYPTLKYLQDRDEAIKDPARPKRLKIERGGIEIKDVAHCVK
jgi:ABC-type multidrug transport system fused ATPase/permease subunit